MADLAETETYVAGIYQLEITDPVIGGPDGIDNLQAKQLANRTAWLKKQFTDLFSGAISVVKATKLATARNINNIPFDGTTDIEVLGTATNAATANTSFYDTDIFGFFGAASGAWRKITGANFKATLKTYFDNVYANISTIGSLGPQTGSLSASFTLTQSNAGKMQVCASGITVTLPPINTITSGSCFIIKNGGIGLIIIALNGNSIESPSIRITGGETLIIQSDGGSFYRIVSRTGRTPTYAENAIAITYNTVYQADTDGTLIVLLTGSYMNGAQILVGDTNAPNLLLAKQYDDINSNSKEYSLSVVIPSGMYYKVAPLGANAFETVTSYFFKHK